MLCLANGGKERERERRESSILTYTRIYSQHSNASVELHHWLIYPFIVHHSIDCRTFTSTMSDAAVNFHFVYPDQPSQTINNLNRKQQQQQYQPASQLINTYLSTAAQYLNRTKSFHVPQNSPFINNSPSPAVNKSYQPTPPSNQLNSARSIPTNMNLSIENCSMYQEHRFPAKPNEPSPKPQGIVSTLRRSLRKNKERFYNKRSQTMKSCASLHTYEQSTSHLQPTSMTPTLLCRQQYSENPIDKIQFFHQNDDDESEKVDRMRKNNNNERQYRSQTRLI